MTSNDILDIRDNAFNGNQLRGWAVGAGNLTTDPPGLDSGSVTATSNRIVGFQRSGFLLKGTGSEDTITDNTIVG